jgi:hypothetical protein
MIRIRIIGLALVAVFAISAVAASTASAQLPEFVRCAKVAAGEPSSWEAGCTTAKASGGYAKVSAGPGLCVKVAPGEPSSWEDAACTKPKTGTGEYIKIAATGKPKFKSTSGESILWTATGKEIKCKADTNAGELTGNQTDKVVVTFTGCTAPTSFGVACENKAAGEIVTNTLKSTLGYIKKPATTKVGLLLEPEPPATLFAEFKCLTVNVKVRGSLICEMTPINTWTVTYKLICHHEKAKPFKQEFTKFEGEEATHELETSVGGAAYEKSGQESTDTITLEEIGEIRA